MESGTITEILFSGGSGCTISAGGTQTSDWTTYAFDRTKDYIISIGSTTRLRFSSGGATAYWKVGASGDAGTANMSGMTESPNAYFLDDMWIKSTTVWQATVAYDPNEVYFDTTRGNEEASLAATNATHDWYWNANVLYVYSATDPDTAYTSPGIQLPWRKAVYADGKDYLTFQNLRLCYGSHGAEFLNGASNIIFDSCEIDGNYNMGITYNDASGPAGDLWTISNCTIHNNGAHGIWAAEYATNWTIEDNIIYENADSDYHSACAGIKTQRPTSTGHIIQNNTIYDEGKNTTVQYHGAGIWLDECQPNTNITVRYNIIYGCQNTGINIEKTTGAHVYYNLCYTNNSTTTSYSSGISIIGTNAEPSEDNEIYNNVCYDNEYAGLVATGSGVDSIKDNLVKNNISVNNDTYEFAATGGGENDGTNGSGNVYEYNCLGAESANFIQWAAGVYKSTYDDWETAYGSSTNSVEADPSMTDPANADFTLLMASPCIDKGTSVGLSVDYEGKQLRHAPDMGAYENQTNVLFASIFLNALILLLPAVFAMTVYRKRR